MKQVKEVTLRHMQRKLWLLSVFKIPLIGFVKPRLLKLDEQESVVKINLKRRTKNHLNSMYFGALAVGADIAAGLHAFYFAESLGYKVSFAFKGMNADFLMRAESDILFKINQGELIREAVELSAKSKERVNQPVDVIATNDKNEVVATFKMIVSVKVK